MTVESSSLALCVHPGYGKALRAQRAIPNGSLVYSLERAGARLSAPTVSSLQVGVDEHLDDPTGWYLNHSCEPNVFVDTTEFTVVAVRDIQPGEDLQYFYPATEWDLAEPFACACGSRNCLGLIAGARETDPAVLDRYRLNEHIQLLRGSKL
ncbi:MAG TPA: SET domain-containing protein-lysine N-methyltransferase [Jatrophihabitans sp.]|nr:SET domain-containing protein-lysine N-methyltransferase [Jatrophihabitans sp.]